MIKPYTSRNQPRQDFTSLRPTSTATRLKLNATSGTESLLDVGVDGELTSGQGTNHEQTGTDTGVRTTETELLGDLNETAGGSLSGSAGGLVDLGQHGVGGLGHNGGSETGDETSGQVGDGLESGRALLLVVEVPDGGGGLLVHDELGHSVRNLLEQNGSESRVESTDALVLGDLGETSNQTGGEGGLRDETDTGSLKGAQGDIGEELGAGGRSEVNGGAVLAGSLETLYRRLEIGWKAKLGWGQIVQKS